MTRIHCVSRLVILVFGMSFIGCDNADHCSRARQDLAKSWEAVKNVATKRKLPGVDESDNPVIVQQRLARWQIVEDKAALLQSSFVTPQVTWQSAARARVEINRQFTKIPESDDKGIPRFAALLDSANQRQAEFERNCR